MLEDRALERRVRNHLARLRCAAEQLTLAGVCTEQLVEDLAEAKIWLWKLTGGVPDA